MSTSLLNKLTHRIDTELLISLVKSRPALWDRGLDAHSDRDQRSAAWRDVCRALCPDYDALAPADKRQYAKLVIKKWTNIRDAWRRSYVDTKLKKKSKPYYYHDYLRFLEKNLYHVKESFLDDDDSKKSRDNDDREISLILGDSDDDSCGDRTRKRKWELQEMEPSEGKSLVQVEENPHVCFVRGLLPTLNRLTEDETLEFQAGVIQLLRTLKKKRAPANEAPGSDDSNWSLTTRGSETDPLHLHEETPSNKDPSEEKPRLRHRAKPMDLKKLLDNQQLIIENQTQMKKNQQKMTKALAEISAKLNKNIANPELTLNCTSSCNTTEFRPIKDVQELDRMEANLEDSEVYNEYKMKYSIVCGPGKGLNCAYQFSDMLFDREFLTKCSWGGGSRSETTKISLKTYKNVLNFFFDLVHDCDRSYTIEDNMNFFKAILKNSMKRSMAKLQRKSASRCRRQRPSEALLALLDNADASADDTSNRNSVTE